MLGVFLRVFVGGLPGGLCWGLPKGLSEGLIGNSQMRKYNKIVNENKQNSSGLLKKFVKIQN